MKHRKNTTQPVRDAAVLLGLILLLLTVRPIGVAAVADLMPETEASSEVRPQADLQAEPLADRSGSLDDLIVEAGVLPAELPGLRILSTDGGAEVDVATKLVCRITRSGSGVDTDCSRIVSRPSAPPALPASWSDSCQKNG